MLCGAIFHLSFTGSSTRCSNALPAIVVSLCLLSELLDPKDPARNAACGLLPVLICRSQAGSFELEQSEYAFSICCSSGADLLRRVVTFAFCGLCAGLLTRGRPREQPGLAVRALRPLAPLLAFVCVCVRARARLDR
ncbi:hypothetical protein MTO96_021200 [Rhipicephalus appendiculatus]